MSEPRPYLELLSPTDRARIEGLVAGSSREELLRLVAGDLGFGAAGEPPDYDGAWARRAQQIRRSICADPRIRTYCTDDRVATALDLAFVVSGKLVADRVGGVDVFAAACLVAKLGLLSFCDGAT